MGAHGVLAGVMPGGEDLLAEEEWSVPLLGPHLLGVLLALRNGVHHVVIAAAQGGHLGRERMEGWKEEGGRDLSNVMYNQFQPR